MLFFNMEYYGSKKIPMQVETLDFMCCWDADQPTLQNKETPADERARWKWGPWPKDGDDKNMFERDPTQH